MPLKENSVEKVRMEKAVADPTLFVLLALQNWVILPMLLAFDDFAND